ncbi:MAG: FKBP-type peptidyl-prolyl cis-trans isomerase [Lachnospiraceae bacterium]|nr:FKBP-type peptidyl-prolyl cis-trans isomerase [Lachnospiraceae bacterium]
MKKRSVLICGAMLLSLALMAGCGDKETAAADAQGTTDTPAQTKTLEEIAAELNQEESEDAAAILKDENAMTVYDVDPAEYITLGDYRSMDLTMEEAQVDEGTASDYANYYYSNYATSVDASEYITDRAVADGDMTIIDYEGKKDGVAFDGGTAQDQALWIGSGSFIPGFESGLIGVMPGETVDLPLTFPADYHAEELAGADVVFTVTVKGIVPEEAILRQASLDLLEEGADPITDFEGLREVLYNLLLEQARSEQLDALDDTIAQSLLELTEVKKELPTELVENYQKMSRAALENIATYYGATAEDVASYFFGMSMEEYVVDSSYEQLRTDLAMRIIADENGLSLTDEEFEKRLDSFAAERGFENREAALENMSAKQYRVFYMEEDVLNWLKKEYGLTD